MTFNIDQAINAANEENCLILPAIEQVKDLVSAINHVAQYHSGKVIIGYDIPRSQTYGIDKQQFLALYQAAMPQLRQFETGVAFITYGIVFTLAVIDVKQKDSARKKHDDLHHVDPINREHTAENYA